MREIFLDDTNGSVVQEGSVIKNPMLANTLELLTKQENVFYLEGPVGSELVDELSDNVTNFKLNKSNFSESN